MCIRDSNGTQALSIAAGHGTYSVGRVQTPTLAMVCERYWENRRFTSEEMCIRDRLNTML